ncbi:deleted in malignant brain tumors 1 protein-like isoform X4 [Carcharodon carcharias]|uniref:deleted in malignant brain tumors 1 protein-like isoform X4 n=1 Tax=Carcharodon carcharias TaxID=13397 RepID=UPI001B7E7A96|nr:deleted in malignant brain tumors 1 protein-like isoform X4 [Carcharodon carcharias]
MLRSFLTLTALQLLKCRTGSSQADPSEAVKLRLANGGSRCAGRVEIHYRGKWGTVDDYSWDLQDAAVVCRELGCGTAVSAPGSAHFGEGSGPVVTYNVQCSGNEAALRDCKSASWDHYSWSHSADASAICSDHRFPRLVSLDSQCSGRLEIQFGTTWGTVCELHWDWNDASVVCQQLQCGVAVSVGKGTYFGEGTGLLRSIKFDCKGNETSLTDCPISPVNQNVCTHMNDVGVSCSGKHGPRLVGGEERCSGRVEVLHGEQWGTLCDIHFGLEDASVVCEHLQCGAVKEIPRNSPFGQGTGPVWKENYRCRGNESRVTECPVTSGENFNCSHGNVASVICSDESWSLRLTNGGSRCDGRVEIYHNGRWGRVQDSLWDLSDATVVCKQLGCGVAIAAYTFANYGESEGPVWVNDVQCGGNESHLRNCSSFAMNSSLNESVGVGVLCSEHKQLRLSDGGSPCAGRVEIYYNGTWGSVCDDSWDLTDAGVVCKQLHCGKALDVTLPASCGPGSGPVWLEGLECSGEESYLWQCPSEYWGAHDCSHKEDVKIMCSEHKELRLVKGKHRCEGRIEVFYNGTWGTVCSETLDRQDAEVICKQLQCGPLVSIEYSSRTFGEGSGRIWLDEIECISHESTIWQCQTDPWGQHNCNHREDAGVSCSERKITKGQPKSEKDCGRESDSDVGLRLIGGNTNCSGRVEIMCKNNWSTVCDDSWDMADANVVCRQLHCGSALLATGGAAFGQGEGDMWFDEVRCTGSESFLSDCPSLASAQSDCDHKEDASVICSGFATGIWGSPIDLYQAIYEEIENIPPVKDPALTRGSVSASIVSLNDIEYYTSHTLDFKSLGSPNPDENSSSIQALRDYDDAETTDNDPKGDDLLLDRVHDDFVTRESAGGDM